VASAFDPRVVESVNCSPRVSIICGFLAHSVVFYADNISDAFPASWDVITIHEMGIGRSYSVLEHISSHFLFPKKLLNIKIELT
jgi:hypothetical protein